jgi:threonine dehydratase
VTAPASAAAARWTVPTLADVLEARQSISVHLPRTPLHHYAGVTEAVGAEILVKHENHLPTGAFKVRGGVNLVAHLSAEERERGLIGASTGNHGQSLAFAGRTFGVGVTICVPEGANPAKGRLDPRARRRGRPARPRLRRGT